MSTSTGAMIQVRSLSRVYPNSGAALDGVTLEIQAREFVAITGPSGCGKSTLMHLLGGLDSSTSGELFVDGLPLHSADDQALTRYRREKIGIVFQFFNLLPTMTVLENVCLPLLLQGQKLAQVREKAKSFLDLVGLADRAGHFVHQLSGGQMQRSAIARALVHEPQLLLADEPTGNLDSLSAQEVMALLQRISSQCQTTMLVVTHSADVARIASRRISMRDGKILHDDLP